MITEKEYLKNYRLMNEEEKKTYLQKVDQWTEETFPNLIALADCWERVPVKEFDYGLLLASAISKARSYIPVAMRYEAERSLRKLRAYLEEVRVKSPLKNINAVSQYDKREFRAVVMPREAQDAEAQSGENTRKTAPFEMPEVEGRRPDHLNEYIDRLPKELQLRSKTLKDDYLALADYRGRVEMLAEKGEDFKDDVAIYAEKSVKAEQKIRAFWMDVDTYLSTGKVQEEVASPVEDMRRPGEYSKEEIDAMSDAAMAEKCKKARIEADKKYVRRKVVKITDSYRQQMALRIKELLAWEEDISEKAYAICQEAQICVKGFNDREMGGAQ